MMQKLCWWMSFALATYALSRVLEASRALTGELPTASWSELALWSAVLSFSFVLLALESYRNEKRKGTVLKSNVVFEFLDRVIPFGSVVNNKEGAH